MKNKSVDTLQPHITSEKQIPTVIETKSLDVRVFFGYKDSRPARFVADRYEKALFVKILTAPCTEQRWDCNFLPFNGDGENSLTTLIKTFDLPGGVRKKVSVRIFDSSVGADDDENRKNPFQKWKSDFTEKEFISALRNAEIIFYNGHSRAGGGPDFSPPKLTGTNHVNYGYYQKQKDGLSLILNTLKHSPNSQLKLLSLHSCKSDQLFREKIERTKKNLKVNGSRKLLYFSDALNESLDQLSDLTQKFLI